MLYINLSFFSLKKEIEIFRLKDFNDHFAVYFLFAKACLAQFRAAFVQRVCL